MVNISGFLHGRISISKKKKTNSIKAKVVIKKKIKLMVLQRSVQRV